MDELDLSRNKFGDEEMVYLSKCIRRVKRLDITACGITSNGIKDLCDAILTLDEPVYCFA